MYKTGKISLEKYKEEMKYADTGSSNFKSSHWDEPNVLFHLRMNDRTYNGKKVSFMEEFQSALSRELREGRVKDLVNMGKDTRKF